MTSQLPQQPPSTSFDLYSGLSGSTGLLQIDSTNSPAELSIEGPRRCHEIQLTIAWASPPSCPALCDRLLCDQRLLIQGKQAAREPGRLAVSADVSRPAHLRLTRSSVRLAVYSSRIRVIALTRDATAAGS